MDIQFTRRSFIQAASAVGLVGLAGCGSNNSNEEKSVSKPTIIGIVSDYPQDTNSSSGSASVTQKTGENDNAKEVLIEGEIVVEGSCQVASFDSFNYNSNEDVATITVTSEQDSSRYDNCNPSKQVLVQYRLRVEFDTLPGTLKVKHKGVSNEVVGTSSLDTSSNG